MEDNSFNRDANTDHSNDGPQGIQLAMQSNAPESAPARGAAAADPAAHNDTDLASGATATGNVITGVGTTTGAAGADTGGANIQVSGVTPGAATTFTSVPGGGTTVQGTHGTLTINPDGSYTYAANPTACGTDIFTYRITNAQGERSTAALTISVLGDTATAGACSVQRLTPGPDGVVNLPANVALSDIHISGRDLVVMLPDGSFIVIVDGAIYVPQLVLGDVAIPPANLAAVLIGNEVRPAAGGEPGAIEPAAGAAQSSGGNFEVPVGDIGDPFGLGDLVPPTELQFGLPTSEEIGFIEDDDEPTITIITPDNPAGAVNATATVSELGLPTRNSEPAGSGEIADGNGSNNSNTSETVAGTIVFDPGDEPATITIDGVLVALNQTFTSANGTLTITSINGTTIGFSYTLKDNLIGGSVADDFNIVVTDVDGDVAAGTLVVNVIDDAPTARNDTDSVPQGSNTATGNVLTGANTTSGAAGADTVGADNATITAVSSNNVPANVDNTAGNGLTVNGQHGSLVLNPTTGEYTYTRTSGTPGTFSDVFTYTLTDGDGDTSTATLTINIVDAPVTITNLTPKAQGGDVTVDEDDLLASRGPGESAGSDPSKESLTQPGTFNISAPDGVASLTIHGVAVITNGVFTATSFVTPLGNTLSITAYNAATGQISYTYTLNDNEAHAPGAGENELFEDFAVVLTDLDGDTASDTLSARIIDDVPSVTAALNANATVLLDETGPAVASTISTGAIVKGNDPDVAGTGAISKAVSGGAVVTPTPVYGADGPGGTPTYALSITNAASGLTVTDGSAINLQLVGGVVVGVVSGGAFNGQAAFAIAIDPATGVVTVEQYLSLDHPVNPDPNDPLSMTAGHIAASVSVVDGDGDPAASNAVDISGLITFLDDGPSIRASLNANATVLLDETGPAVASTISTGAIAKGNDPDVAGTGAISKAASGGAIVTPDAAFGADGPSGSATYALSITNAASGLTVTDGSAINLQLVGGVIVGVVSGGAFNGQAAFAIAIDAATGVVTVEQYLSLDHPVNPDPNDPLSMTAGHIAVTVSATDGDGDPATSNAVDISGQITFLDDGPSGTATLNANATVTVDESLPSTDPTINTGAIVKGNDPDLAGGIALGFATSGAAVVSLSAAFGADGPGAAVNYVLSITNAASGLTLTDGSAINLQLVGGVIVGVVAAGPFAGQAAFAIAINATTGVVSVEQYLSLDHPVNPDPNDPLQLGDNTIAVTVSGTDGDGDPVAANAVDISDLITFLDDGPTITPTLNAQATVTVDESLPSTAPAINTGAIVKGDDPDLAGGLALGQANSGVAIVNANAVFGADGPAAANSITYALSITNAASGVTLTDGTAINLQLVGGVIVGVVAAGAFAGQAAFAIAINAATGVVSVEQYLSLDHPVNPDPNDPLQLGDNTIAVTVTATDGDGDPVTSGAINISDQITFLDDGPSIDATLNTQATVTVDESLPSSAPAINTGAIVKGDDPDLAGGLALGQANSGVAIVNANAVFGADGPAVGGGLTYALSITNAASGVTLTDGTAINLQLVGGVIVGVVAAGTFAGQAAFAIAINSSTGVVSVEQYLSLDHPVNPDPNDPLQLGDNTIAVTVSGTDGDGDPVTSGAVNISDQITFLDDGPAITTVTDPLNIDNDATPSGTGTFAFTLGADGAPSNNDVISVSNFTVSVNGVALLPADFTLTPGVENATDANYTFSFDYDTGSGGTATAQGTLVFHKTLGTYEVTLTNGPIQGFSILQTATGTLFQGYELGTSTLDGSQPAISVTQIQGTPGDPQPSDLFVQFTSVSEPSSGTGTDNLRTIDWDPDPDAPNPSPELPAPGAWEAGELFNQVPGWVSTSNDANGVDGDTIQGGEVLDFVLVKGDNPTGIPAQPEDFGTATSMFLKFDGIGTGEDMIVILKLYDPGTDTYTTRAVMIQNADIIKGPRNNDANLVDAPPLPEPYQNITLDNNDGFVAIESNDYNGVGENWVIVGAQIAGSDEGVTGTAINLNPAVGDAGGSSGTQSFATDTNDGPFKISSIGFLTQDTTDQSATLEFDVTVTDGDGDPVTQTDVTVNIGTPVPPVVLDMDGDGAEFLSRDAGVAYDYGSGSVSTAWAGADDAILVRDANGNGTVDDASEFVFGGDGQTDLEALASEYGATLDSGDADFAKFGVWQDANSNGAVDAGEFSSLADAGITSVSLVSDGQADTAAGGDVDVAGSTTYTRADGTTGIVADAAFWTGQTEQQKLQQQNSTLNTVTTAALAAGLAATAAPLAAAEPTDSASDPVVTSTAVSIEADSSDSTVDSDAGASNELLGDSGDAATVDQAAATSSGDEAAASSQLVDAPAADAPVAPTALLDDSSLPLPEANAAAAASVDMAAQLIALPPEAAQVVADALSGGTSDAPSIDQLLSGLPGDSAPASDLQPLDQAVDLASATEVQIPQEIMHMLMEMATTGHDAVIAVAQA